jgi:GntR family transcriptional regulator, sialic acid-inducible nan operon repressor
MVKALDMLGERGDASEKITRRKLSDEVLDRLQEMLRRGEYAPGDSMPSERELMERFGVGRPAIREALQTLANMGLISISHGERAKVSAITAQTAIRQVDGVARMLLSSSPGALEHLKSARRFFELGMVREAAERATAEEVATLRDGLARQRALLGDRPAFIRADIAFHRCIAAISGNPIFAAVSEAMLDWLFHYHSDLLIWTGREDVTLAEHAKIIDHIAAHDPAAAEEAMREHLDRSGDTFRHKV